jgi:hypothetical protein
MDVAFDNKGKVIAQVIAWAGAYPIVYKDDELKPLHNGLAGTYDAIPADITFAQWSNCHVVFRVLSHMGFPDTRTDVWSSLGCLSPLRAGVVADLLMYQGKASFYRSLQDRILTWCCTPPWERAYPDPLSQKQWAMVKEDIPRLVQTRDVVLHVTENKDLKPFG